MATVKVVRPNNNATVKVVSPYAPVMPRGAPLPQPVRPPAPYSTTLQGSAPVLQGGFIGPVLQPTANPQNQGGFIGPILQPTVKGPVLQPAATAPQVQPAATAQQIQPAVGGVPKQTARIASYKYNDNPTVFRSNDNYGFSSWQEFLNAGGDPNNIEIRNRAPAPVAPAPPVQAPIDPQQQADFFNYALNLPPPTTANQGYQAPQSFGNTYQGGALDVTPAELSQPQPEQPTVSAGESIDPSYEVALQQAQEEYLTSLQLSPEEIQAQRDFSNLQASIATGIADVENKPIPMKYITGQAENIEKRGLIKTKTLQDQLALAQAKRQSAIDVGKAKYGFATDKYDRAEKKITSLRSLEKPVEVGGNLVRYNSKTGKYETVFKAPEKIETTSDIKEYQYARSQGYQGSLLQYQQQKALMDVNPLENAYKQAQIDKIRADIAGGGDTNKVLSPTDAIALGVPYGTTQGQAMNMGITPQKPLTEGQAQASTYAARLQQANPIIDNIAGSIANYNIAGFEAQRRLPNNLKSGVIQSYEQAARNFINAVLRRESGAAIAPSEFNNAYQQYLPYPGDKPETLAQKKANRDIVLQGLVTSSGGQTAQGQPKANDPLGLFKTVGNTTASTPLTGMRTDRNNNPTAFTTDVAKSLGLVLGKDYTQGDKFPGNSNLYTARLVGDPVAITIKGLDQGGFYTQSGKPRWTHTAIPQSQWNKYSYAQKVAVVKQMYQKEGNKGALNQYFA